MFQLSEHPQTAFEVVRDGIKIWRQNFMSLLLLAFVAVFFGALPNYIFPELNITDIIARHKIIGTYWPYYFIYLIVVLYFFSAILYRTNMLIHGQKGGILKALLVALKRLPWVILALIIADIIIAVGLLLVIIPGLIAFIILSMYFPLIVIEDKNPIEAVKISYKLVWGNVWRTFWVVLFSLIVFIAFVTILNWLVADLWAISHPRGGEIWVLHHTLHMILGLIYYPLFCSILLTQLHDLRLRAKGL